MNKKIILIIITIIVGLVGMLVLISGLFNKKQPTILDDTTTTIELEVINTNIPRKQKKAKKVLKTTKKTTKKKVSAMNVKASKSEMQEYAKSYIGNDKEYEAFDFIITHESGWNPNSINKKSNATGLCQSLPGSKMKSEGADWKTNYKTQVRWCVKYCQVRYGSIQKAKQFWLKHHWF